MRLELVDINENVITPTELVSISLNSELDAACDSISFKFMYDGVLDEIVSVRAYDENALIFNGLCDCQRLTLEENGCRYYIYARSTAGVLVDNQAKPFTYNCPSARQLFECNAKELGFEYEAGDIACNNKYEVPSGTSCFGAINSFVSLLTGLNIYVTPTNVIKIREYGKKIKRLSDYPITSVSYIINRSEPISEINFKRPQTNGYLLHTKSKLAQGRDIKRQRYINLSSLPQWQRDKIIQQRLEASFNDYSLLEVDTVGYASDELLTRFTFPAHTGESAEFILVKKKYSHFADRSYTRLTLRRKTDLEEITYVD